MRNIFNGGARDAQAVLSALDRSLAVVEFDMQGNILRANRQFCAATGYAVSELVGRHHSMFVDETTAAGSGYREFWNKLGGFDPAFFMYGEEAALCLRAHALGARPLATPDATIIHHGGASAASRALKIIQMHGARAGLSQRHIPGIGGKFASEMLVMGAWLRKVGYGLAARLSGKSATREAADNWRIVWDKRNEWRNGPKPPQE